MFWVQRRWILGAKIARTAPCRRNSAQRAAAIARCARPGRLARFWALPARAAKCVLLASFRPDLGASSSAVCRACPVGTFSPTPGQSAEANCTQCPAGTYGVEEAQTSASMACVACLAGTYSAVPGAAGGAACEACPAGKYGTGEAQTSEAAGCALCPAGKYGSETGAPAAERCFNCPRGTYQPLTGRRKEASCLQCPEGSSQPNSGATSEDACIQCPAGKFAEGNLVTIDDCKACPLPISSAWARGTSGRARPMQRPRRGRRAPTPVYATPGSRVAMPKGVQAARQEHTKWRRVLQRARNAPQTFSAHRPCKSQSPAPCIPKPRAARRAWQGAVVLRALRRRGMRRKTLSRAPSV